ncbi:MAG: hypothetical protein CVU71_01755 [Deltaproteobacteria bacterium HGW-Deltaproteobacteria-6]|jgi:glycosyltransferase involved in cell wall biosynthesis|nr:MAG: hypothetical protein CVU71_01755 [Deltaproteobacteria bacterium HGW-Deltaproteobacteria-6]
MITFLIILIGFMLVSSIIARHRNAGEMEKAAAAIRSIDPPCTYPIIMPVYGRPHYLKEVLQALARVKDIDKTILIISQDGSNPEVTALISEINFTRTVIIQHTRPFLGILAYFWDSLVAASANIHFLLKFTFSKTHARGAIVLEDDILPCVDFFNYYQWAFQHVLTGTNVLSVTGFNIDSRVVPDINYHPQDYPYDLVENRENNHVKFCSWSWGITRDKWQQVRKHWSFASWDLELDKLQRKLGLISYKPVLGRVRNIGMHDGINFTEADDNPKWRDIFIAIQTYNYTEAPRLHQKNDFVKLSYPEDYQRPYPNEKTRTRKNRLWLLAAVILLAVAELYVLLLR